MIKIEQVFKVYYKDLLYFCQSLDYNLADDIVSETFLKVIQNQKIFDDLSPTQQKSWLFKTAKNKFIDMYRKASKTIMSDHIDESIVINDTYSDLFISELNLSDNDRELLIMRYIQGYNSKEIGEILGLNDKTVRWKLHQIKKKIKKEFNEYE